MRVFFAALMFAVVAACSPSPGTIPPPDTVIDDEIVTPDGEQADIVGVDAEQDGLDVSVVVTTDPPITAPVELDVSIAAEESVSVIFNFVDGVAEQNFPLSIDSTCVIDDEIEVDIEGVVDIAPIDVEVFDTNTASGFVGVRYDVPTVACGSNPDLRVQFIDGEYDVWLADREGGYLFVTPDGHVASVTAGASWAFESGQYDFELDGFGVDYAVTFEPID